MKYFDDYKRYVQERVGDRVPVIKAKDSGTLSFTPYISNPCSARCQFCSEKLSTAGAKAAALNVCDHYCDKLVKALLFQKDCPIFLSISGMEPSESPDQLTLVKEAVALAMRQGCRIISKVTYSNLSGFTKYWDELTSVIKELQLTRIECSRHHFDEDTNQSIVRFRDGEKIRSNAEFRRIVQSLLPIVPMTMACVMQKNGIATASDVISHLEFAREIGIKRVVFRELSVFSDDADNVTVASYITDHRVELMDVLESLPPDAFELLSVTEGYYYYSFEYRYKDMTVLLEMSDYNQMKKVHYNDTLHKLIFYSNGDLCRDWNMKGKLSYDES